MNKLVLGALTGIAAGYCIRKMQEEHKFDPIIEKANDMAMQAKKKVMNMTDMAKNEAEYVKDKAENFVSKEKSKVNTAMNDKGQNM